MNDSVTEEHAEPERVVARLKPHARAVFWPNALLIAVLGLVAYFAGRFPEAWENTALLIVAVLLVVLFWLVPVLRWLGRNYTITTRRVVIRSGLATRRRQELLHSRGTDVTVVRRGLQQVFRSGDVAINTGLDHPVVLVDVPRADLVQSALHELMERSRNPVGGRRQQDQRSFDGGGGWPTPARREPDGASRRWDAP